MDPHNTIITDIDNPLALDANGKAEYIASFVIRKPKDMTQDSGRMWHDVTNRGGDVGFPVDSFAGDDVQLDELQRRIEREPAACWRIAPPAILQANINA